jgi:serine/threonine protein kinase
MWELGEVIYSSPNWIGRAVNHVKTGKAARLSHLQATGAIADKSDFILAAAERASRFNHPNLVQVIDWGSRAGRAYVVTAAQGRSLEELVDEGRPLEEHMTVPFMASLADALSYLHASGFVFQLLDPGGMVVGSDARSALLTWPVFCVKIGSPNFDAEGNSQRFGVKAFAPPEVLSGSALTIEPSADIFGLGATFYYLLAGKNAYYSAWCEGKFPNVRRDSIPVTAPFACLITQLIHPDPQQRPSAQKVKQELSQIAGRLGIQLDVLSDG